VLLSPRTIRSQRGQTAVEYLGLLLLLAVVVAALLASPIGGTLSDGIRAAICRVLGGDCETAAERRADGRPPLSECVLSSSDRGINGAVKAFWVELGGGVKALREERADGSRTRGRPSRWPTG